MANNANIRITAEDRTRRAVQSAQRNFMSLASTASKLSGVVAGLAGAAGFGALIKSQMQVIDSTAKTADKLGVTTEALTSLQFAVGQTSQMTDQQFNTALQRMVRRLGDTTDKTGPLVKVLGELGLKAADLKKVGTEEAFYKIGKAITETADQSKQLAQAMAIFDTEGVELVNTFRSGEETIRSYRIEAEKLGMLYSSQEADKVEALNDEIDKLSKSVTALGTEMAIVMAGPATEFINGITNFIKDLRKNPIESIFMQIAKPWADMAINAKLADLNEELEKAKSLGMVNYTAQLESQIKQLEGGYDGLRESVQATNEGWMNGGKTYEWINDQMDDHVKLMEKINRETERNRAATANQGSPDIWQNDGMDSHVKLQEQTLIMERAMYNARIEASTAANEQINQNDELLGQKAKERAEEWRATWEGVTDSFSAGVGDAFASAIMDQESLGKGLQQVMRGVAKQVISSLIQIGIQRAIQAKFGMSQTVAQTALGVKSAATLATAYAPAALAVNIATAGGAGLAAASSSGIAASAQIASMASTKAGGLMGQAHDGLDYVPRTGTYLLEKGERVVKKEDNQRGMMGNTYNFTIQAIDTQSGVDFLMQNEGAIASMVQSRYESRGMTGGPIR